MSSVAQEKRRQTITTPTPRIKIAVTAWMGTSREKRWSLLKPVTVIGSRKHAQIQAREEQVSRSHAAIVNNGTSVLLVDLLSETGTYHNGKLVSRTLLQDGDIVRAGSLELSVSIELPANPVVPRRGMLTFVDPFAMPTPMRLVEVNTDQCWELGESVSIIGSCRDAQIVVSGEDVARAHSMIFATIHGVGIVDLGSSMPLKVNGTQKKTVFLKHQDRLLIGRAGLMVSFPAGGQSVKRTAAEAAAATAENVDLGAGMGSGHGQLALDGGHGHIPQIGAGHSGVAEEAMASNWTAEQAGVDAGMTALESKINDLQQDLAQSWGQINEWKQRLTLEHNNLAVRGQDLENKEKELRVIAAELDHTRSEAESQDAKLKTRYAELTSLAGELDVRRKEIERSRQNYEAQREEIDKRRKDADQHDRELAERRRMCESELAEVTARKAEADRAQTELDEQDAALKTRYTELTSLASELDERRAEVERFSQEYEAEREEIESKHKELEARETQLRADHTEIDQQRQSLEELSGEVDQRTEGLDGREAELSSRENQLEEQEATVEQTRQELDALREELGGKEEELTNFESRLTARREKLIGQARSLRERSKIIDRFGQFLTEATEAYDITVHAPVEVSPEDLDPVPGLEHSPEESLADASRAISRAGNDIHSTVASLQDETKQMIDELPTETSAEEGSDVASRDEASGCAAPASQQEADGIDLASLEPEVRERFRACKRLGSTGKTDADLVEQIRKDLKSKNSSQPKGHKKRAWWKG